MDDYDMEDLEFPVAKVKKAKIDNNINEKEFDKYMSELIQYLNKKNNEETLADIYDIYTKDDIINIAKLHHMKRYSSYKKAELIKYVIEYITSVDVITKYFLLLKDIELEAFEKALKEPCHLEGGEGDLYEYLLTGGYLALSFDMKVVVPSDVAKVYRSINTKEFHEKRKRICLISEYLHALNYLYGVTPMDIALDIFNKYEKNELNKEELIEAYESIILYQNDFVLIDDKFVDITLVEGEVYKDFLKEVEGKSYYVPSKDKISQLGNEYNGVVSEELYELYSMLLSTFELDDLHAIDVCALVEEHIRLGCSMDDLFEILKIAGVEYDSRKQISDMTGVLSNLWNHTRMIRNLGFTPNELAKINAKIGNNNLIPFKKDEQKVYPNDPCPCGSGKKYKICCKNK